jgi:hypothetical protein
MHMILALALTAFAVGGAVVYIQPYIAAVVPASLQTNKFLAVLTVGALTLASLFVAFTVLRVLKLPRAL